MITLTPAARRALRARAHALHPVVSIGDRGLTPGVVREIAISLEAHELIKVKVTESDRKSRDTLLDEICEKLGAAPVQHIGKVLVIFRPTPIANKESPTRKPPRKPDRRRKPRTKRDFQSN